MLINVIFFLCFFLSLLMFSLCVSSFLIWDFIIIFSVEVKSCLFFAVAVLAMSSKFAKYYKILIFARSVLSRKKSATSVFRSRLVIFCVYSTFFYLIFLKIENRLEFEKIKFYTKIKSILSEYSVENKKIQNLYFRWKKLRDVVSVRESNLCRLLVKQIRFVQCFKTFEKKKNNLVVQKQRVLFRLNKIDDSVIFYFNRDFASVAQETFIELISEISSEKVQKFLNNFELSLFLKSSV